MTAADIINSSLRSLNVLAQGETPSADESQDALSIFNLMLDSWNAERLMIIAVTMKEFSLTALKQAYTLGPNGDFNVSPRPAKVERYGIVNLANPAQPLELPLESLTLDQWAALPVKLIGSTLPTKIYDDNAFPLRNLSFWPYPTITNNLRVYYWTNLTSIADLSTYLYFPPGYLEAIKYNLTIRLAPEFGTQAAPEVVALASESKANVKRMNAPVKDMMCDPAIVRQDKFAYNWLSDTPVKHF